jgi:ribose transport system permease protein
MIAPSAERGGLNRSPHAKAPASKPYRTYQQRIIDLLLEYGLYVALIALFVTFSFSSPYFLSVRNLLNVGQAVAVLGIMAAGVTIALVGGQLDLSIGATLAMTTIVIALLVGDHGIPLWLAIVASVVVALGVGLFNSILVVDFGINSIITTLATSTALVGLGLILTQGKTRTIISPGYQDFMFRRIFGIPTPVLILIAIYVIGSIFLSRTQLGWHIFAVGGNASAATRAGIKTAGIYRLLFLQSAALGAIGGIIIAGRTASGSANYGGDVLDVLTAVLLGGIGLGGGGGRIERTLAGVLLIGMLANGMVLMNVPSYYQQLVRGGALILAVVLDSIRERRMAR